MSSYSVSMYNGKNGNEKTGENKRDLSVNQIGGSLEMKGLSISGLVLGITATGIGVAAIVLSAVALGKDGKQF